MSVDLRLPNITASTEVGQMQQMKSYLHQLVEQLNFALSSVAEETSKSAPTASTSSTSTDETTAQTNFNAIKGLIIKSAEIVNAYYEEINRRLTGIYVAESDFGTYREETEAEFQATSSLIQQNYTNMQTIVEDINARINEISTSAYIKSGRLGYTDIGSPIYGIEVGETVVNDGVESFNKFARFTSDRLSFYDSDSIEVAYVSDYKLVITNAEIKGALTLGNCEIDTTDGLAFKCR